MCILCDARKFNNASGEFVENMAAVIADAVGIIEHMKARGIVLDADEKAVYEKVFKFAKGTDEGGQAQDAGEAIRTAIQQAFPGAQVVIGTPEQIAAIIEKDSSGDKPN